MDILHPLNDIVDYREVGGKLEIVIPKDANKKEIFASWHYKTND